VDGQGHLVLALCALSKAEVAAKVTTEKEREALAKRPEKDWIHAVSDLITRRGFLHGYHEVRFKLPNIPGPGFCFWFPSTDGQATEIDVIEQTLYHKGALVDYKASTIHWYPGGYKPENRQYLSCQFMRTKTGKAAAAQLADKINAQEAGQPRNPMTPRVIDNSTAAYCARCTPSRTTVSAGTTGSSTRSPSCGRRRSTRSTTTATRSARSSPAISKVSEPAIFSLRCMDSLEKLGQSPARNNPKDTPAKVLVDYYRVLPAREKWKGAITPAPHRRGFTHA